MSCPDAPSTPTVVHASPVPGYLAAPRWHPSLPTLERGVVAAHPCRRRGLRRARDRCARDSYPSVRVSLAPRPPRTGVISSRRRRSVSQRRSGPGRAAMSRFWVGRLDADGLFGLAPPSRPSSLSRHEHCSTGGSSFQRRDHRRGDSGPAPPPVHGDGGAAGRRVGRGACGPRDPAGGRGLRTGVIPVCLAPRRAGHRALV